MSVQTVYGYIRPAAIGQMSDMYFNEVVSKSIETAGGADFGIAVGRGTGDDGVVVGGTYGITVRELTREADARGTGATTKYNQYNSAAIMLKGHIQVELDISSALGVVPGDPVYSIDATGVIVDATTLLSTAIPGATFEGTASAGEVVEIRIG